MRQVALPLAWEMLLVRTNELFPNFNCQLIASTYLGSKPIVASPKPAVAAQPATELQTGIYIFFSHLVNSSIIIHGCSIGSGN